MDKDELGSLQIVGLGPGDLGDLTLAAYEALQKADKLFLRTVEHPVVTQLKAKEIDFNSFDDIYESQDDFIEVYNQIVNKLLKEIEAGLDIVYGVPGNPLVAEKSVQQLLAKLPSDKVGIIAGLSFLEPLFIALELDPIAGLQILDALSLSKEQLQPQQDLILTQVYNSLVAADLKLTLLEVYPAEHSIQVVRAAGVPALEKRSKLPLYQLDRLDWLDHLTTVHVPPKESEAFYMNELTEFKTLVQIMAKLRGKEGCPWDLEQTHDSLRPYLIEEAYEVLAEIEAGDIEALCEELGDLLLQVIFHAQIAKENNNFEIEDVIYGICEKMIKRHPHVFSDEDLNSAVEVEGRWEEIKNAQKSKAKKDEDILATPKGLPSLMEAQKVQQKAATVGFDWESIEGALAKLQEELGEFAEALEEQGADRIREELGDVLFAIVNIGRFLDFNLELVLRDATQKFKKRFADMETELKNSSLKLEDISLIELEELWQRVKKMKE
ncbi:nucleoside triphosphate pyrophosphohydrolase [Fuchsiella alkaliacetigena]|uniref:nucleoside triphosphate pyrophosphohydrolase n=1 Tax=Fuchsiella alkaliacetigena TaxID=957042 RepID=UPI00200B0815|nr:nucleoside triphosphate pyrophosphohydrolase [Fuchsiella alkaliacetigena]MCK8824910.1 nucleoside triphosphate pyrophosphohydrolase [Fuchsiella alkaliacetigena]